MESSYALEINLRLFRYSFSFFFFFTLSIRLKFNNQLVTIIDIPKCFFSFYGIVVQNGNGELCLHSSLGTRFSFVSGHAILSLINRDVEDDYARFSSSSIFLFFYFSIYNKQSDKTTSTTKNTRCARVCVCV